MIEVEPLTGARDRASESRAQVKRICELNYKEMNRVNDA